MLKSQWTAAVFVLHLETLHYASFFSLNREMLSQETKTKILELYEEHSAASLEEIDALASAVALPEVRC